MEIRRWCNSGVSDHTIHLGEDCSHSGNLLPTTTTTTTLGLKKLANIRWRQLWMKLKRKRVRVFEGHVHGPYNLHSYAQNFDHGLAWEETENLSRSFSVRFSNPSRIFPRKKSSTVRDDDMRPLTM